MPQPDEAGMKQTMSMRVAEIAEEQGVHDFGHGFRLLTVRVRLYSPESGADLSLVLPASEAPAHGQVFRVTIEGD